VPNLVSMPSLACKPSLMHVPSLFAPSILNFSSSILNHYSSLDNDSERENITFPIQPHPINDFIEHELAPTP